MKPKGEQSRRKNWFGSIRSSMLLAFLPVTTGALLILAVISFRYTQENVMENSVNYTMKLIRQVERDLDSYFSYMKNIAWLVSGNQDVTEYLFSDGAADSKDNQILRERIIEQFEMVQSARTDIYNIGVISNAGRHIINDGRSVLNPYVEPTHQEWYQETLKRNDETVLTTSHVQNLVRDDYTWVVTVGHNLQNPKTNSAGGVFFIDLNYSTINDLCTYNSLGNRGYIFILDDQGDIVYHPKQQLIYSGVRKENIDEVMNCNGDYFQIGKEADKRIYTISTSAESGWKIVGVSYTTELMKNQDKARQTYMIIAIIMIILVTGITYYLSRRIIRPVEVLETSMKQVEKGNFPQIDLTKMPENELGSLSRSYNIMTEEIQQLMDQNIAEQQEKRKSEMKALQAQINPHFLYNTLDSIVWMAEWGKTREVVKMTTALSKMFRRTISTGQEEISVAQEFEHVRNYLDILELRYKDKLEVEIYLDPDIEEETIVKFVIQPLVENAVYHGVRYKETKSVVTVIGRREGELLIFEVTDTGPGIDKETLLHIFDEHKVNYERNGVGVYNVQRRLKNYYGEEYGITYRSKPGEGTTAKITIPDEERRRRDDS